MFTTFPENAEIRKGARVKFGIDPTLDRLHLGHFVPLRLVKKLQQQGHPVTIVLGTFTAQLGDPSGRDQTRPLLSRNTVEENADALLDKLRGLGVLRNAEVFRNGDVFNLMPLPKFMAMAAQFTTTFMLSRDAFQKRIEDGKSVSLHELLVPICQGWDSVHLQTEIEIGGTDQLFNFQVTRQLQEWDGQKPEICLMTPIINGTDGRKMSKSFGNCIFLDESSEDIFGKVMSISDEVMEQWFPLFVDEGEFHKEDLTRGPMHKKKVLAFQIVKQVHGVVSATDAWTNFENTVQRREAPVDMPSIKAEQLHQAIVLIRDCSKSEAHRLLKENAVKVNGVKQNNGMLSVMKDDIIQVGKRDFGKIS